MAYPKSPAHTNTSGNVVVSGAVYIICEMYTMISIATVAKIKSFILDLLCPNWVLSYPIILSNVSVPVKDEFIRKLWYVTRNQPQYTYQQGMCTDGGLVLVPLHGTAHFCHWYTKRKAGTRPAFCYTPALWLTSTSVGTPPNLVYDPVTVTALSPQMNDSRECMYRVCL